MVIDEVDYDSTTLEGQRSIFVQVAKPKQAVQSNHTLEKLRHDPSNKKDGKDIIPTRNGESKKCTGAKVKKSAAELIVGKDISLSEVLEYLFLALVERFCGKTIEEDALRRWMEVNWNPFATASNVSYSVQRLDFVPG